MSDDRLIGSILSGGQLTREPAGQGVMTRRAPSVTRTVRLDGDIDSKLEELARKKMSV